MWPVQKNIWIYFVLLGACQYAHAAMLRCYNGNLTSYITAPLNNPVPLMKSSCFDETLPTVFYTFGFKGRVHGNATTAVLRAYLATKKRNVILLDWENEASSGLSVAWSYLHSAVPSAKEIGDKLGNALVLLAQAGLRMKQVHLMGHSLGAHLMGYAGKSARSGGYIVPRITGLDPASICFEGLFALNKGLDKKSAKFVDIIHTSPGSRYGLRSSVGTVDIWPNYAGDGVPQPGCPEGEFKMFSADDLCSHDRSWQYFVESLSNPTAFLATSADSFERWAAKDYNESDTVFVGELTSTRARGNYYLTTNAKSPFGKGPDGIIPDPDQIRRRTPAFSTLLRFLR